MSKPSKITNLLVIPLIASAIFLANPALAKSQNKLELRKDVRNASNRPTDKKNIIGTVSAISGNTVTVTTKGSIQYTVDVSHAAIMKDLSMEEENPSLVNINQIKVGDELVIRGRINDTEINADSISPAEIKKNKEFKLKRLDSLKNKMLLKKKLKDR